MKLAIKLGFFLVLGMWLVLALEFWISAGRELRFHEADTRQDQHVAGQVLRTALRETWRREGRAAALALVERADQAAGETTVRWIELDSLPGEGSAARLARLDLEPLARGEEVQRTLKQPDGPGLVVTAVPVTIDGRVAGALELTESLVGSHRHVQATLLRRLAAAGLLGGLSGVIAMLLGALLVGRPMRSLVDKTRRIAAGDLSSPIALRQRDEVGELAREIDAMCERLVVARERIAAETAAHNATLDQLRHADRLVTVGKLASGVAHELGTPLTVASQRAKMIASGETSGPAVVEGARIIAVEMQRMTSIIRQLLTFARRHAPNKARHDLRRVARETAGLLAPLAERGGVAVQVEALDAGPDVEVDAEQIRQALANLIVNGIQAMPDGGALRITVGTRFAQPPAGHGGPPGDYVVLSVRDQGGGIAPEHLPHVFEPFFTTKDVGEGTGLGLAVAHGIVQDHGGWIEVDSALGQGSCFSICLPLERAQAEDGDAGSALATHDDDARHAGAAGGWR